MAITHCPSGHEYSRYARKGKGKDCLICHRIRERSSGNTNPRKLRFEGHSLVMHGPGDWRCKCGVTLGRVRREASDVMRFHRVDLWMQEEGIEQ